MTDITFIEGLIVKAPRDNAPPYVKAAVSIKRADLIKWLQSRDDEWINADIKESQSAKWYVAVNDWKPEGGRQKPRQQLAPAPAPASFDDDLDPPF